MIESKDICTFIFSYLKNHTAMSSSTTNTNEVNKTSTSESEITKNNYSESELSEFEELLLRKKKEAQREYDYFLCAFKNHQSEEEECDNGGLAHLEAMIDRQGKFINNLDRALGRIQTKTYGICLKSGELIPKKRLLACPVATTIVGVK
jgi:RNA polymerase-binding transcription factor DksA